MMVDIFSSFDPATTSLFNFSPLLFWSINFVTIAFLHPMFWTSPSQLFWMISIPTDIMTEQSARTATSNLKGMTTLLVALYILITMINFMGVIPYVFSSTSHLIFTLSFGLPLWLSLILSSASFSPSTTLAALLPGGAPTWLNPFLVLIETVSTLVRPITLSFRLAANMSVGHVVLTLLGVYFVYALLAANLSSAILLFMIQFGYTIFELGICVIQAYIFCLLLSL
uniref:ATP synthase subunit a n=1 Tax=Prionospio sp. 7 MH-2023 TaxID=3059275 RepID=A0AAU6QGK1_9ANNE